MIDRVLVCLAVVSAQAATAGAQAIPSPSTRMASPEGLPPRSPASGGLPSDMAQPANSNPPPSGGTPADAGSPGTGERSQPPSAEVAPTETEGVAAAADTNWLARFLGIEDSPVKVYGWIQNSYTGNTNGTPRNDSNFSVFPNRLANRWQGNQYYVIFERPFATSDKLDLGFRVDTLFGNDWQFTKDWGLFDRAFKPNSFAGVDLPQLYVEAHLPVLTAGGLDLRLGRYYTPSGFESVQAVKRPLLSVPYMFNYSPFTYLGLQSILHVNPQLSVCNALVNGNDRWLDERYHVNYHGGYSWTSKDATTTWASYVLVGPDQLPTFPAMNQPFLPLGVEQSPAAWAGRNNPLYAHHPRTYFDTVVTHKWTKKLTQASEAFFIIDTKVPLSNGTVANEASWYGYANWFLYTFDPDEKFTGVWRSEVFEDTKGTATGVAGTYYEMTLGLIYKPKPWLWIRPEARYDWNHFAKPFSDGTRGSQFLLAFDVIVQF
ncbi:MAG: outer membrane beta-barrel protein [Isosphaeraceae bacterium]|nr:outer membrane beta-barrel protein [Isosphaeraceae bacterium]